jgi:uncharacterized membrane protein
MLIGEVRRGSGWLTTIETPVIASFAMVFWDLAMDPTRATIQKLWIWEDSGGFFGVPLVNFLGWSLTTYLFMQLFALYLRYYGTQPAAESPEPTIASDVQALLLYAATAGTFVIAYLTGERTTVTDALGQTWRTGDGHLAHSIVTRAPSWRPCTDSMLPSYRPMRTMPSQ